MTYNFSTIQTFPMILVTGGTGWLGKRLIKALTQGLPDFQVFGASAHPVIRCLVQASEPTQDLLEQGIEVVVGDIRDPKALAAFTNNAEGALVLHLSGIIHPTGKTKYFNEVNYLGSLSLYEHAKQAGVKKFIAMSSNSPLGCNLTPNDRFNEESAYNPYMGYGQSKYLMEKALKEKMLQEDAPEISIIRAPWFYGPEQPERQTTFFTMIKNGRFPIIGNGLNRRSMAYVDSLALGLCLAANSAKSNKQIFWIADEKPYSMLEIIDTVQKVLAQDFNIPVRKNSLKAPALIGDIARIADAGLQSIGLYHQKIHVLSEMNQTIACDISKSKNILGFKPVVELYEGMRRSIEWCLNNNITI